MKLATRTRTTTTTTTARTTILDDKCRDHGAQWKRCCQDVGAQTSVARVSTGSCQGDGDETQKSWATTLKTFCLSHVLGSQAGHTKHKIKIKIGVVMSQNGADVAGSLLKLKHKVHRKAKLRNERYQPT